MKIVKVISGGQTGADRAGLDAAISMGIPHGGRCPKGRRSEDGGVPESYDLKETVSSNYLIRTSLNVKDSDATLIFTFGRPFSGSKRTIDFCIDHERPYMHVDLYLDKTLEEHAGDIRKWLESTLSGEVTINIAGSRESKACGIHSRTKQIIELLLKKCNE